MSTDFRKLVPNSYQDTLAYRLCTLTSGCGALYIIGLSYFVRHHSGVEDIPSIFTPIWAGIFLLVSSVLTIALHNNRSRFRLVGVLVCLLVTLIMCVTAAFTTAMGSEYFKSEKCSVVSNGQGGKNPALCMCGVSGLLVNGGMNQDLLFAGEEVADCHSRVSLLRGLMLLTCTVCIMTIFFLFMQICIVLVQIRTSTSLAEISNAIINGAGPNVSSRYSHGESGTNYAQMKEESTRLVPHPTVSEMS